MKSEQTQAGNAKPRDALILVDLQKDFLPGGAVAVPGGDEVIPVANRLQPLFDAVIAARDWHPPGHGSFAASHPGLKPGEVVQLGGIPQVLWPVHCVQHTPGAALAPGLEPLPRRLEVFKGQDNQFDSRSGFFDNGYRRQTELDSRLRSHGVRRVFIMGLATDYGVKFTALDARELGYETYLIEDGCRGVDVHGGGVGRAIEAMRKAGVVIVQSHEVPGLLDTPGTSGAFPEPDVVAETSHLRLLRRGHWDFVSRTKGVGAVVIVAVTPARELLLVEQYRPPLARKVFELPAGLIGDMEDSREESFEQAAGRELLEETGYRAENLRAVFTGPSSAGLTDELITFVMAEGLERVNAGGGDAGESITVHRVPLSEIDGWLRHQADAGQLVSSRVLSGIYLLQMKW